MRVVKYDYVFCDESQDFSLCQQQFIRRLINRNGRVVTVGDPRQAIYGFAGADNDSYNKLAEINGKSVRMPLSVCYRCGKNIVLEAKNIVDNIQYNPDSVDGVVEDGSLTNLKQGDWILCRNLKPLVQTYLWLMKNRVKSKIRGKDIGEGILGLLTKIGVKRLEDLKNCLDEEYDRLIAKLKSRGIKRPDYHPKAELLLQRSEVLLCLAEQMTSVKELRECIEDIFTDEVEGILLSTIHKSKGLENNTIYFLCPELIPSRFAVMDWQFEQEQNLRYVAITRAKKHLIYVSGDQFISDITSKVNINR
jgi:superfamily I DNA/RNA helicase